MEEMQNPLPDDKLKGEFICIDKLVEELNKVLGVDGTDTGEQPKIAISIAGGGAAGAFEAGVIEALKKKGIKISFILGASAGALNAVGIFYKEIESTNSKINEKTTYDSYIARVWSFLDEYLPKNNAARFVLNKPNLLTSLCKNILGRKKGNISFLSLIDIFTQLINSSFPLLLIIAGLLIFVFGLLLHGENIALISLIAVIAGLLLSIKGILSFLTGKSVFENTNLYSTLCKMGQEKDDMNPSALFSTRDLQQKSKDIVNKWYQQENTKAEMILTGTDLTMQNAVLFTLVKEKTYKALVQNGWYTAQLLNDTREQTAGQYTVTSNKGIITGQKELFIDGEHFFDAVISSTSIPAIFPAAHIPLLAYDTQNQQFNPPQTHIFTDGGVLNSSPINVAIDAGATHVISLELGNLFELPFSRFGDQADSSFSMGETFMRSFLTLGNVNVEKDISGSASWNKFLVDNPDYTLKHNKKLVPIYRIAPELKPDKPSIGLIDFNGRYKDGERVTTLTDWMDYGQDIALNKKSFWRATKEAYPVYKNQDNDQYGACTKA